LAQSWWRIEMKLLIGGTKTRLALVEVKGTQGEQPLCRLCLLRLFRYDSSGSTGYWMDMFLTPYLTGMEM